MIIMTMNSSGNICCLLIKLVIVVIETEWEVQWTSKALLIILFNKTGGKNT